MAISKFHGKWQIPQLGSKFCGPRKTVGPNNDTLTQTNDTYHVKASDKYTVH